jgi:hypothetical protein
MAYEKSGLSYFEDGGSSNVSASVPVKVSAGKSAISPAGNVNLPPEQISSILQSMRQIEAERNNPMRSFIEGLQEASVWGSGGAEGPGANLLALRRQKELEREARMANIERMGALEASQAKATSDQQFVNSLLNPKAPLPGTVSTAGGTPTMSPTTALSDSSIPESVKQQMLASGNATTARQIYTEYLNEVNKKRTGLEFSADMRAPVEVAVNGEIVTMTRAQFEEYAKRDPRIIGALRSVDGKPVNQTTVPGAAPAAAPSPAAAPRVATATVPGGPGVGGGSKQAIEANIKLQSANLEAANKAFLDKQYAPLAETVEAQKNDILLAENVLDAIKTGKYGPGSTVWQLSAQGAQALGLPLNEKDRERYLSNLSIEQAKRLFVASGARAAMGAQFTQVESERFEKTLAGIGDPIQYIKNVYQLKIALAKANQEYLQFLDDNPQNMPQAKKAWKQSGRAEQILNENVDYLRERNAKQKAGESKQPQKTVVRTGKVTNPNNPNYRKTVTEYSDGTREIK